MIHRIGARRAPAQAVPLPPSLELEACYRYCEALCHAHHHNFPVASFFARSHLRKHIWAMFAFARVADDFADEPAYEGRRARELDRWEELLHETYYGRPPEHPVFIALADTIRHFNLPIVEFTQLLSGFRTDLETRRYATWNDLRSYTRQAAEPVGHLLLYIGGYRAPELHAYADDLASGLALARLIQDMPADWSRGRVYIPAEDLRHFGVTDADIAARRATPQVGALVRYLVARTRAARAGLRRPVGRARPHVARRRPHPRQDRRRRAAPVRPPPPPHRRRQGAGGDAGAGVAGREPGAARGGAGPPHAPARRLTPAAPSSG